MNLFQGKVEADQRDETKQEAKVENKNRQRGEQALEIDEEVLVGVTVLPIIRLRIGVLLKVGGVARSRHRRHNGGLLFIIIIIEFVSPIFLG